MGTLELNDPIDLEMKIIDMQAKMKYINERVEQQNKSNDNGGNVMQLKLDKLEKKAKKLEDNWREEHQDKMDNDRTMNTGGNYAANLANQAMKLKNQRNMKKTFLETLKKKVKENLKEKNELLASRVE